MEPIVTSSRAQLPIFPLPSALRHRRRRPTRTVVCILVFSLLAALTSLSTCSFRDAAPSPQLAGFPVRGRGCRRPVLVPCRAHHRRETLHCCARLCLPSRLVRTHFQIGPRCRLSTPPLPRSARTPTSSLGNVFAYHHVIFSKAALLDSMRLSTPGCRSPPRRAPALQHRRHPFTVMSQAFVNW
jgi:hypothetical protein